MTAWVDIWSIKLSPVIAHFVFWILPILTLDMRWPENCIATEEYSDVEHGASKKFKFQEKANTKAMYVRNRKTVHHYDQIKQGL